MDCHSHRSYNKENVVKTVEQHTHKSPLTPTNLEEQKMNFLNYGILPTFTLSGTEEELEAIKSKEKSKIRFDLLAEAENILNSVKERYGYGREFLEKNYGACISKEAATDCLTDYLEKNKLTGAMSIVWCKDLASSARMLWCGPSTKVNRPEARRYSFWLKDSAENAYLRQRGILCLADHEIATHFLRALNDGFQPWYSDRKRFGLQHHSSYELLCTEEGLACIHSTITSKEKYLWTPALLYYTACQSTKMTFKDLFDHLAVFVQDPEQRWKHVMRTKRLLPDVNLPGGYGKDQCYFEGAVSILRDLTNIDFEVLMSGRITKDEVSRVKRVARLNISTLPQFMQDIDQYRLALHEISMINGLLEPALPAHLVPRYYNWKRQDVLVSSFHKNANNNKTGLNDKNPQTGASTAKSENTIKNEVRYHVYEQNSKMSRKYSQLAMGKNNNPKMQSRLLVKAPAKSENVVGKCKGGYEINEAGDVKVSKTGHRIHLDKQLLELAKKLGIAHQTSNCEETTVNEDVLDESGVQSYVSDFESSLMETKSSQLPTENESATEYLLNGYLTDDDDTIDETTYGKTLNGARSTVELGAESHSEPETMLSSNRYQIGKPSTESYLALVSVRKSANRDEGIHMNINKENIFLKEVCSDNDVGSTDGKCQEQVKPVRKIYEETKNRVASPVVKKSEENYSKCSANVMRSNVRDPKMRLDKPMVSANVIKTKSLDITSAENILALANVRNKIGNSKVTLVKTSAESVFKQVGDGSKRIPMNNASKIIGNDLVRKNELGKRVGSVDGINMDKTSCTCSQLLKDLLKNSIVALNKVNAAPLNGSRSRIKSAVLTLKHNCNQVLMECDTQQQRCTDSPCAPPHKCKKSVSTQTQARDKPRRRCRRKKNIMYKKRLQSLNRQFFSSSKLYQELNPDMTAGGSVYDTNKMGGVEGDSCQKQSHNSGTKRRIKRTRLRRKLTRKKKTIY